MAGRVRLKLHDHGGTGRERAKQVFRDELMALVNRPFISGALRTIKPRAHALSVRRGEKVETWYVSRAHLKEVREMTDRYRTARELLTKIAGIEFSQLKERVASAKKSAKTQVGRTA